MKWFIDTNVVLDFLSGRQPFYEDANRIILYAEKNDIELSISSLSFTTLYYILKKQKTAEEVLGLLDNLQSIMEIIPVDRQIIHEAIHSGFADFEDAVQYFSAWACDADTIITRDKKGFILSKIEVVNPADFGKS